MKIAEAKTLLELAGYHVEYTTGNANMYVRTSANSHPTIMHTRGGSVSGRTVKRLLKRKGYK